MCTVSVQIVYCFTCRTSCTMYYELGSVDVVDQELLVSPGPVWKITEKKTAAKPRADSDLKLTMLGMLVTRPTRADQAGPGHPPSEHKR